MAEEAGSAAGVGTAKAAGEGCCLGLSTDGIASGANVFLIDASATVCTVAGDAAKGAAAAGGAAAGIAAASAAGTAVVSRERTASYR
jgi:hypothetical protein